MNLTPPILLRMAGLTRMPHLADALRQLMSTNPATAPAGRVQAARPATRPRRWLPYLLALVLAGLLVWGLWPQPVPVETARVSIGTLRVTVNEEGRTRIRQRYVVSAPVTGQLRRILFKAG